VLIQPDVVIEILSPDDRSAETLVKVADYIGAGVPHIWIVDPYRRNIVAVENGVIQQATGPVLESPLTGKVDFGELFRAA